MYREELDKIHVIYRISGMLINESPLCVGAGRGEALGGSDNPVIRMGGIPYIPGSTLKGSLRSEAERYARTYLNEFVCDILNPKGEDGELKRKEKLKESYRPCIICRVFGGPTIASHLTIRDSIPKGNVRTEKRTSVSISRITGGQYPGRLYDVEYVVPDSEFKFEMIIENLDLLGDSSEAKIVRYLLSLLQKGMISIGRRKSTGMGKVRLKELKATRLGFEEMGIKETEVTEELIRKLNES